MRKTLKHFLAEYGAAAVVVYLAVFFFVLFAAWGAIHFGWDVGGVAQNVGAFTAAYLTTKVVRPLRIAATLAITPLLVRAVDRSRLSAFFGRKVREGGSGGQGSGVRGSESLNSTPETGGQSR